MSLDPVVQRLREIERAELDVRRIGHTNDVKYNTAYYGYRVSSSSGELYAWCVVFQWWCFQKAGIDTSIFPKGNNVFATRDWFKAPPRKAFFHKPKVGDLVIYKESHMGFVEKLLSDNRIQTIEGNFGNKVTMRKHRFDDPAIDGFCRPDYSKVKDPDRSPGGVTEVILQSLPRLVKGNEGADVRRLHGLLRAAGQELPGIQNSDGTFKGEFTTTTANALRALTGRTTVTAAQWKHLLGV